MIYYDYVINNNYLCIGMKKICIYPFVFILSALIFYGGSGINIASFCCKGCKSEGIAKIAEGCCHKTHCHDHEDADHQDSTCDTHEAKTCCALSRIIYDWNTSNTLSFKSESVNFELIKNCLPNDLYVFSSISNDRTYESATSPPFLTPRDYLSLLTTLLI